MKKITDLYKLTVHCDSKNLEIIRDFVNKLAVRANLSIEKVNQIEMAVDEAATNVMKHAYGYDKEQKIVINVKISKTEFVVEIIDRGSKQFDPERVQKVDIDKFVSAKKHGGLGIHLMNTLMDDVQYFRGANNYNRVKLIKKR
jgi:serine/threonine-protein kinase RsbW